MAGANSSTDGQANTLAIVSALGSIRNIGDFAAKLCNELTYKGYSDFYLPASSELSPKDYKNDGLIKFNKSYWSSSQNEIDEAYAQRYSGFGYFSKKIEYKVICIRKN